MTRHTGLLVFWILLWFTAAPLRSSLLLLLLLPLLLLLLFAAAATAAAAFSLVILTPAKSASTLPFLRGEFRVFSQ